MSDDPFFAALAEGGEDNVRYKNIVRGVPPYRTDFGLVRGAGWWGCGDWLVRGSTDAADGHLIQTTDVVGKTIERIEVALHTAVPADLGPARFTKGEEEVALKPIHADSRYTVDPTYLLYAEAIASVQEWRWLPDFDLLTQAAGRPRESAGLLVGLRDEQLVAVVCPLRRKDDEVPTPTPIPGGKDD